jgi:hypothetical protein
MNKDRYPLYRPLIRTAKFATLLLLTSCATQETTEAAAPSPLAVSASSPASATGKVCDGLFTRKLSNGNEWVVGRPVIDGNGSDMEVLADQSGVRVNARTYERGAAVTWYTLQGQKAPAEDIHCAEATLHSRKLTQPNDKHVWVATTNPESAVPGTWDAEALNPKGFGGAGLDYGEMPAANLAEMLTQAAK